MRDCNLSSHDVFFGKSLRIAMWRRKESKMKLEWTFTAETYLDQLSSRERSKVLHAVDRLLEEWDDLMGTSLNRLTGEAAELYALRVGSDLRVLLTLRNDLISVVDIVRKGQVEGLRRLAGAARQAAAR
jgi:mRNA-degrading endonuclease RelE of RelBE toxin-antitoxin system